MIFKSIDNPIAKKRLIRFKEVKRAYISLWILVSLYLLSLCSELICNNIPLYVRFNDRSYFPIFKFYPEDVYTGSGKMSRPDYKKILASREFKMNPENMMIFPLVPYGPLESISRDTIDVSDNITMVLKPSPQIGTVNIRKDYSIARSASFGSFLGRKDRDARGLKLTDYFKLPETVRQAVKKRFKNRGAPPITGNAVSLEGVTAAVSLSTFSSRGKPPNTVRLTFRDVPGKGGDPAAVKLLFDRDLKIVTVSGQEGAGWWDTFPGQIKKVLLDRVQHRIRGQVDAVTVTVKKKRYTVSFHKKDVHFPFNPARGHLMGIDGAGRDVLARILYGLRTSLTFGLLLVICSMALGIVAGAIQGYYGGAIDITAQRFIEIWSALPFLYIMILMGSTYGRSFSLLLFCYGLFNWIGISYYIRAEFLRLRKQTFVEAAKCMGIPPYKVIFKHILPNALVPVITFFPFSLVGAIGALAALDYLGFGLPPPTPSWGELLFQAQQYRWAWWLILYPSLLLFIVMLLGVFVGEGVRNAYDPKRFSRLE